MYRILVADDEALIRQGIQCLLDYEALGFTICGEAASGEQALEKILGLQPDVVLMDIRMPGMTGLEVIRSAQEQGYRGEMLIISGFSDFSYARKAIRYGVQGYLTKPIDEEELEKLLRQFKTELDQESSRDSATRHYREMARASLISNIFQGKLPPESVDLQPLGLKAPCYQVVLWDNLAPSLPDLPQRLSLDAHPELYDAVEIQGIRAMLLKGAAPSVSWKPCSGEISRPAPSWTACSWPAAMWSPACNGSANPSGRLCSCTGAGSSASRGSTFWTAAPWPPSPQGSRPWARMPCSPTPPGFWTACTPSTDGS